MSGIFKHFLLTAMVSFSVSTLIPLQAQVSKQISEISNKVSCDSENRLNYVSLHNNYNLQESALDGFVKDNLFKDGDYKIKKQKTETDNIGFTHTKYNLYYKGVIIDNAILITHSKNGQIISLNGDLHTFPKPKNQSLITEATALQAVLKKVNAKKYMWENKADEESMKKALNDPAFSYTPKGELVLYTKLENEKISGVFYAYKFNIYAEEPLYRAWVFVDAQTGTVLDEQNQICGVDAPSTATTKYSGVRNFISDNNGGSYRLRETGRGNGIETYNMKNGNNYAAAIDFTNTTTNWSAINVDQAARDAHWGTEMVYDYFFNTYNRNSIDNAGFKLLSYVHYQNNYNNAFWDGQRMTYGDGNGSVFTILTDVDVCGHEIGHGLINKCCNLNYGANESGALHEGFADIWATTVENYAKPNSWDWLIGSNITPSGAGIRNMQNPKALKQPDCYLQVNWSSAGQQHNNNGPCIYWYYLLCQGGAGVNDLGNNYNISPITMAKASAIAYRALTVYFTPTTKYADARQYTIQAAIDLYGKCSNEEKQTTNAWYAVGVGGPYAFNMTLGFTSGKNTFCKAPATVNFTNTTTNASTWEWSFGDGAKSFLEHPSHTYTASGTYTIKLKITSCFGFIIDSLIKTDYVKIYPPLSFLSVPNNTAICAGESVHAYVNTTGGSGMLSYSWSPSIGLTNPVGTTNTITPNFPVNYSIIVSDAACPTETVAANFMITVNLLPKANISLSKTEGCVPLCVDFDPGYTQVAESIVWNFGNGKSKQGGILENCFEEHGDFQVSVKIIDKHGCKSVTKSSLMIKALPLPGCDFATDANNLTDFNNVVNFNASHQHGKQIKWSWDFGDPATQTDVSTLKNPTCKFERVGTYSVVLNAVNEYGCTDMAVHEFIVNEDIAFYVPNAFTPNGDGFNDVFFPKGSGFKSDQFELMIFDRDGVMMYKTNDVQKGWDGTYKGVSVAKGVYVYQVKYVTVTGNQRKEITGAVMVL